MTVSQKKKELIKLAKTGIPRVKLPDHWRRVLHSYVTRCHSCFDPPFRTKLEKIAPHWFKGGTIHLKKAELLKIARSGKKRPCQRTTTLGRALQHFIDEHDSQYDAQFKTDILKLRPDWFRKSGEEIREELMKLATSGQSAPQSGSQLWASLMKFTIRSSKQYHRDFDQMLRAKRPDWFIGRISEKKASAASKKQMLVLMAMNGDDKPHHKEHPLGVFFYTITQLSQRTFDEALTKELARLRPDWFPDQATENKKQLIEIAKAGEKRPSWTHHPLGRVLCHYTQPTSECYDEVFDKEIRSIRPEWFLGQSYTKERWDECDDFVGGLQQLLSRAREVK